MPRAAQVLLLGSVFVIAACGLVYELVLAAVSSYLLGDAVTQFSLVIGVFLSAMGVGSFLARFVRRELLRTFVEVEIWIGLVGGVTSIILFAVYAFAEDLFQPIFYTLCASLGIMVGIEIPLLVRLISAGRRSTTTPSMGDAVRGDAVRGDAVMSDAVSEVLALDYVGALAGSLLFPFVALPFLGLARASVVFGLMNLAIAGAGLTLVRPPRRGLIVRAVVAFAVLIAATAYSARLVGFLEDLLYQDDVIVARDTPYQRIVITRWRDDIRLYLDGHLQFSAIDEARYHEALVVPAMEAAGRPQRVLVLGGGDGLAARVVLSYPAVKALTVVDLDPTITDLARSRPELVALNRGALDDPKVEILNQDAFRFLRDSQRFYDVILVDLPDPSSPALSKLYSTAFYALAARRLSAHGVLATQATSPFYARRAFWSIVTSIEQAVAPGGRPPLTAHPYHLNVPSFGEWGFVLATTAELDVGQLGPSVETRFLTAETLRAMFAFGKDLSRIEAEPNRLDLPVLDRYYREGWERFSS